MAKPKTCETCDWWCYGTWPGNTCDRWEETLFEVEVPDELIDRLTGGPTPEDMARLWSEVEKMDGNE